MLIDTKSLQPQFDDINQKVMQINALTSKDPRSNFYAATVAFSELANLYERLGKTVFHMQIDDEHKQAIEAIQAQMGFTPASQITAGDSLGASLNKGNQGRECEVCHDYIAHNIVNDKFCCEKCFNSGAAYRD
jgi:hypothetical protein